MDKHFSFKVYDSIEAVPPLWDALANANIFLGTEYLRALSESAPSNMECRFIAIFKDEILCGIAISQFLNLSTVESFGERDKHLKTKIRHAFFKLFGSNVLIIGNNMLTGQNAFAFHSDIAVSDGIAQVYEAMRYIRRDLSSRNKKPHLIIFKDFYPSAAPQFILAEFEPYFQFSTQPNMVLKFKSNWNSFDDYVAQLTKKYRDQFKRARKKSEGLTKRKLNSADIDRYNDKINELYFTVAHNAPFNTFYLAENHFAKLKANLKDKFLLYGYFEGEELIGFNTLIKNGNDIDTYFLGYDEKHQREKMLYLNMLYDMIGYSINKGFRKVILARTALEIKSSVGAIPESMIGYIKHSNLIFNVFMPRLFKYFEPELKWQQRHPFKN